MSDEIIISKVAPRLIERTNEEHATKFFRHKPEPLPVPIEPVELTLWQKARLVPYIIHITWGVLMKNPKTTITGIVGGVAYIANALLGVVLPSEAIITVTVFLIGLFSKDADSN
ncbi:MAG TPA: hypothetical protein DCZ59_08615 [Bacteroidetes bacterium]|nr:hypothetical protein [Bacteroidota bacterium]